jgi:hypothetical protein
LAKTGSGVNDIINHTANIATGAAPRVVPPLALAPAGLLVLNLLFFGPLGVYLGNTAEFLVPLQDASPFLLLPGLALLALLLLPAWFLRPGASVGYNAALIFLAVVTYLHGSLLRWNTGMLDGSALDLDQGWRSLIDAGIWLALGWLCWRYRAWLARHGWKLCVVLALFQAIGLAAQAGRHVSPPPGVQPMPEDLARLSGRGDVIHIVLDGFQANVFEHLIDTEPGLAGEFDGFTFFRDAVTPSDVTYLSVPATLSGRAFDNQTKISTYLEQTLGGDNLFSFVATLGYAVDVATPAGWMRPSPAIVSHYRIPTPYSGRPELSTAMLLLDLSLFRQAPHFLKALVYHRGAWLLSSRSAGRPGRQFDHFAHNDFLADLTSRLAIDPERPRYKFIHVVTPHAPLVTAADCSYLGSAVPYSIESCGAQTHCTLARVAALLRRLRELGVYDSSLILIHGDHGGALAFPMRAADGGPTDSSSEFRRVWGNPLPAVLIKAPGQAEPLRRSNRAVSLMDVPATVAALLDAQEIFPGSSMFAAEPDMPRTRYYHTSTMHRVDAAAKDQFDEWRSFAIRGSIYEVDAWSLESQREETLSDAAEAYSWGTRLTFGKDGNFKPYQDGGWSNDRSGTTTWTRERRVGLQLPMPMPSGAVRMRLQVKPFLVPDELDRQRIGISVNGSQVTRLELTREGFQELELLIPAELFSDAGPNRIEFDLPDARSPKSLGRSRDLRELALAFMELRFEDTGAGAPAPGAEEEY